MTAEEQEAHFQRWLRDHVGLVLKVVRACAETPHDQEDLFQDVLVNLWSSIPNFRGDSKETTWIYRVMHLDGLSYQEMSEVLGISENYIGVKLTRIRKQIAEQLGHPDD